MDIEARIANLDKKIQEYIDQGRKKGIFNDKTLKELLVDWREYEFLLIILCLETQELTLIEIKIFLILK